MVHNETSVVIIRRKQTQTGTDYAEVIGGSKWYSTTITKRFNLPQSMEDKKKLVNTIWNHLTHRGKALNLITRKQYNSMKELLADFVKPG